MIRDAIKLETKKKKIQSTRAGSNYYLQEAARGWTRMEHRKESRGAWDCTAHLHEAGEREQGRADKRGWAEEKEWEVRVG